MISGPPSPQNSDSPSAPMASGPAGFGSLAKKITSRTTDLIAIAMVLAVGLSVGGSLIDWWRVDPEVAAPIGPRSLGAMQWGADGSPVALQFGSRTSTLSRQTVTGNRRAAEQALRTLCRQIAEKSSVPTEAPDERERWFLNSIRTQKPIETRPGRWRLYRINAPVLMVVGISDKAVSAGDVAPTAQANRNRPDADSHHHPARRERVLCWGLAFPTETTSWTLYTFRPSGDGRFQPTAVAKIPLPSGSRRILSVQDHSAGEFSLFVGTGPPEVWRHFFDEWFQTRDRKIPTRWHEDGERWWRRFVVSKNREGSSDGTADVSIADVSIVDVIIGRNSTGTWTGAVRLIPAARSIPIDEKHEKRGR